MFKLHLICYLKLRIKLIAIDRQNPKGQKKKVYLKLKNMSFCLWIKTFLKFQAVYPDAPLTQTRPPLFNCSPASSKALAKGIKN